jgi:hypothetical protein
MYCRCRGIPAFARITGTQIVQQADSSAFGVGEKLLRKAMLGRGQLVGDNFGDALRQIEDTRRSIGKHDQRFRTG